MPVDAKLQAIRLAMDQIEKQYGKGSIMRLGEQAQKNMGIDVVSTGILPLDLALGVGGVPRGRVVEIYGPEASGKTTVCLSIIAEAQKLGGVAVIVIDSVAALVPRAEIEGEMGDSMVGVQARLMSQALRKLTAVISKSRTVVIFTNQLRQKIGIMFGNPETTPGGLALKFYSSVRIDVRKIESLKDGDKVIGSRHRARVVKNKVDPPLRVAG